MNPLTLAELRARQSELALQAEQMRAEWRNRPMGRDVTEAVAIGKDIKDLQTRADDYAALIRVAEGMQP